MPETPEDRARKTVDDLLGKAGWLVQDRATVEAKLKHAAGLRQGILKLAFEGKPAPQDPTDEAATVLLERTRDTKSRETIVHSSTRSRA